MCGIFVSYKLGKINNDPLDIIQHRGPDAQKMIQLSQELYFGHVRLSIIDLSTSANQPFFNENKAFSLVFNGEIYNYLELKKELEVLGYVFKTSSDTEVLLKAYIEWGKECLHKFNGMFAFVIYDKQKHKLFAARDRFGIKPLYFYQTGADHFSIASEIKQFTTLKGFNAKANLERCVDYLSWRITNHTNETFFKNVYQLKGGQYIELDLNTSDFSFLKHKKDWYSFRKLQSLPTISSKSEAEIYEEFQSLLQDSVKLRLRADVDISTCLSGGMDSSALSCLFNRVDKRGQIFFTCCNYEKKYDEFEYAKSIIEYVKTTDFHKVYLENKDIFKQLAKVIWFNDEPVVSNSQVTQHNLFKKIGAKFRVTFSGQGADEILGIYGQYHPYLNELLRSGNIFDVIKGSAAIARKNSRFHYVGMFALLFQLLNKKNLYSNQTTNIYANKSILSVNPHNALAEKHGLNSVHSLKDYNILLTKFSSLPMLLQYDDRNSMAYSVESRLPFLDYRLVEFVLSVSASYKIKNGSGKNLLRESLKDILPQKIYNRQSKLGFATPQKKWANNEIKEEFLKKIRTIAGEYQFLDQREILGLIDQNKHSSVNSLFWRMIGFDSWAKQYNVKVG